MVSYGNSVLMCYIYPVPRGEVCTTTTALMVQLVSLLSDQRTENWGTPAPDARADLGLNITTQEHKGWRPGLHTHTHIHTPLFTQGHCIITYRQPAHFRSCICVFLMVRALWWHTQN